MIQVFYQIREMYPIVISKNIEKSQEYKECLQLLNFQSKDELCNKMKKITDILTNNYCNAQSEIDDVIVILKSYIHSMENLENVSEFENNQDGNQLIGAQMDRKQLKQVGI